MNTIPKWDGGEPVDVFLSPDFKGTQQDIQTGVNHILNSDTVEWVPATPGFDWTKHNEGKEK